MTQFLNGPITAEEIKKAMQKLKCKKAADVDGISAKFYKYGCNELLPTLELLFNTILTGLQKQRTALPSYASLWHIIVSIQYKYLGVVYQHQVC